MFPGWMQIALVVLLIVLLFGRGKISELMGDVAKGITSFRKGLKDGTDTPDLKSVEDKSDTEVAPKPEKTGDKADA
ncbi:twin-arginine translocase TatA/TatE family subunit [Gimibacter soli]|uniref:Sec-independent protein translocase protein TatA n=1 Tax=Gimibacter soli TaxID=3024400 RepID=A0AAE9XQN5_9PROT|nr:twin-arginine translocase TatA/TatE family subunit [Gimibacter soli]WCL53125.1 twin-arginine translocase TatA/TatE family subunit [Gimibacter soli]